MNKITIKREALKAEQETFPRCAGDKVFNGVNSAYGLGFVDGALWMQDALNDDIYIASAKAAGKMEMLTKVRDMLLIRYPHIFQRAEYSQYNTRFAMIKSCAKCCFFRVEHPIYDTVSFLCERRKVELSDDLREGKNCDEYEVIPQV